MAKCAATALLIVPLPAAAGPSMAIVKLIIYPCLAVKFRGEGSIIRIRLSQTIGDLIIVPLIGAKDVTRDCRSGRFIKTTCKN
jgi:hypothetical protein